MESVSVEGSLGKVMKNCIVHDDYEKMGKSNEVMSLNFTMASFNKSRVQVLLEESLKD